MRVGPSRRLNAKNWCFWTVVLEKTLESPLDCKEIQPVHSERDQPWDFFGRNDATAETPVLGPPHVKSWLTGKVSDAGRDWGQEEKGMTEDEMAGCHHRLDGHEFERTPGVGDGQGGLACCNLWGHKESDTTEQLNWTTEKFKKNEAQNILYHFWKSTVSDNPQLSTLIPNRMVHIKQRNLKVKHPTVTWEKRLHALASPAFVITRKIHNHTKAKNNEQSKQIRSKPR